MTKLGTFGGGGQCTIPVVLKNIAQDDKEYLEQDQGQ